MSHCGAVLLSFKSIIFIFTSLTEKRLHCGNSILFYKKRKKKTNAVVNNVFYERKTCWIILRKLLHKNLTKNNIQTSI